jgi:hypothetical protein
VIFLAGLTILKKKRCLGILSACGGDPVVALRFRNAADYRPSTFGPHGTKLRHSWFHSRRKVRWLTGLTILKKGICLGILSACGVDPAVVLRLRNAAEYRLPTFGPHGSKLGHSCFQWKMKSDCSGWFDNSEKGDITGHIEWMWDWSCGCTPPQEYFRLPHTYFWTTWHQIRAFLISVKNKKWSLPLVWQFWKRRYVWACWVDVGVIPWLHSASGSLPTFGPHGTKLGHSWFELKKKSDVVDWFDNSKKRGCVWAFWALAGLIPQLHSASGILQTTAYLLLDHIAPT